MGSRCSRMPQRRESHINPEIVYVATHVKGAYRSIDGGSKSGGIRLTMVARRSAPGLTVTTLWKHVPFTLNFGVGLSLGF
jgi:hypothetical protein